MAFFKYSVKEILNVAVEDDPKMEEKRKEVRSQMEKKFGYYERRSDDMTCEGEQNYSCRFGNWRMFVNKTLGGTAQPFGQKKFTKLKSAQQFACDKRKLISTIFYMIFFYLNSQLSSVFSCRFLRPSTKSCRSENFYEIFH